MDFPALIEAAKNGRTEAGLAAAIPISRMMLNEVKQGKKKCPEWIAARLAQEAGQSAIVAALECHLHFARSDAEKKFWTRLLKSMKS